MTEALVFLRHDRGADGSQREDRLVEELRRAVADVGPRRADNNHPFRMRQWLFAHAGMVEGFAAIQPRLLESMPDFLRRNLRGDTDSEHVFHVFLSFLHDAGQLDSMDVSDQAVLAALRSAITLIDRLVSEVGAPKRNLDLVLTNGRQLYALRRGTPIRSGNGRRGRRSRRPHAPRTSLQPVGLE